MIKVSIPGKLILAGEWNCLAPGRSCIVVPVDRFLIVTAMPSTSFLFFSPDFYDEPIIFDFDKENLDPLLQPAWIAMHTALQFLQENNILLKPCALSVSSDISTITLPNGTKSKIGLGSSAALIVGIIKSLLLFYAFHDFDALVLFKLSIIAHLRMQSGLGSGADCAACAYAQPILYQTFNAQWLQQKLINEKISGIVKAAWPQLCIKPITLPETLQLLVGFVGYEASTTKLIAQVHEFKKNNLIMYQEAMDDIEKCVQDLVKECREKNIHYQQNILHLINKNRFLLLQALPFLETPELHALVSIAKKHGAAAKFSGAGGGDCGIALYFDKLQAHTIKNAWTSAGIYPLELKILR